MSATRIIIARHGNTFREGDTPTRVGARTDLPLTEGGEEQALKLGHHLASMGIKPQAVFTSELKRTIDTARLACVAMGCDTPSSPLKFLNEIDYGPDENQTDEFVIKRLGDNVLKDWDEQAVMPDDWSPRPVEILVNWKSFLKSCTENRKGQTTMVVTSNGIARFALPHTQNGANLPMKLKTGAFGILEHDDTIGNWHVKDWNIRP
ncbi:MAG: histidine phosphatase family protein [Alphaproteobacteria bacterium]|nr:histidine phosphatase family protein [Alphaproteobacteria bacterium]